MFDSLKFALSNSDGTLPSMDFTALSLLDMLFFKELITRENAYDICNWLAHAEPRQKYNAGTFTIIALDY